MKLSVNPTYWKKPSDEDWAVISKEANFCSAAMSKQDAENLAKDLGGDARVVFSATALAFKRNAFGRAT